MGTVRYENQGTNTYLVYEVDPSEEIDTLSLGMMTNNKIPGIAAAIFTQMDANRYIKYNISSKVSAKQIFSGVVNKKRLAGVFKGIVNAMMSAEDYMLDPGAILLDLDYIFADATTCETVLICYPVNSGMAPADLGVFFKDIMFRTQFDQTENCDHVAKIINYLNSSPVFSLHDFKKVLNDIEQGGRPEKTPSGKMQQRGSIWQPESGQPVVEYVERRPVAGRAAAETTGIHPAVSGTGTEPVKAQPAALASVESKSVMPKPAKKQSDLSFAMPQASVSVGTGREKDLPETSSDEKQISLFYLLQHYNKENAEAYRAQKAAKKAKSSKKAAADPIVIPGVNPGGSPADAGNPVLRQVVPSVLQTAQPEPHSASAIQKGQENGFGDTVYMGENEEEERTIFAENLQQEGWAVPYLVRMRNQEKILIDKPVFRLGKGAGSTDYCVSDNPLVSRSHATIITREGRYFVLDTNSTNHTFINGNRIQSNAEAEIIHGDKIRLGNEEFEFRGY